MSEGRQNKKKSKRNSRFARKPGPWSSRTLAKQVDTHRHWQHVHSAIGRGKWKRERKNKVVQLTYLQFVHSCVKWSCCLLCRSVSRARFLSVALLNLCFLYTQNVWQKFSLFVTCHTFTWTKWHVIQRDTSHTKNGKQTVTWLTRIELTLGTIWRGVRVSTQDFSFRLNNWPFQSIIFGPFTHTEDTKRQRAVSSKEQEEGEANSNSTDKRTCNKKNLLKEGPNGCTSLMAASLYPFPSLLFAPSSAPFVCSQLFPWEKVAPIVIRLRGGEKHVHRLKNTHIYKWWPWIIEKVISPNNKLKGGKQITRVNGQQGELCKVHTGSIVSRPY